MFQFNYILTEDDYLKFNINHTLHTENGIKSAPFYRFIVPFIFVLFTLIAWRDKSVSAPLIIETVIFIILGVLWLIFYEKCMSQSIKINIKRLKKYGKLPYNEKGTLIFDNSCFYDKGVPLDRKISYQLIEKIYTTNEALYIYLRAMTVIILPYRFIENQVTFNNLLNFLHEKTDSSIINITK